MEQTLFDEHYQRHFLNHFLRDSEFALRVYEDVTPELFTNQIAQRVIRVVKSYVTQYKAAPDTLIFRELDKLKESGLLADAVYDNVSLFIDDLYKLGLQNRKFLLSEFNKFLRHQMIKASMPAFFEHVKKDDLEAAEEMMKKIFTYRPKKDVDLGREFTVDPSVRIRRRLNQETRRLWTLIPEIDCRIEGLQAGELGVLQSQRSSAGKTTGLNYLVRSALFQGKKVLVYVLEGGANAWEDRLDLCIAGVTRSNLTDYSALYDKLIKLTRTSGQLWIKDFPMYLTKVSDLRRHHDMLESVNGFCPDLVVVDYADLLAPETKSLQGDLHAVGAEVYGHLIGWMQEDELYGWTAAQSGRAAMEALHADQQHMGGSIAKVQLAHLILSINRTEAEEKANRTRLQVVKNREGPARYEIQISHDYSRNLFRVTPPEAES